MGIESYWFDYCSPASLHFSNILLNISGIQFVVTEVTSNENVPFCSSCS